MKKCFVLVKEICENLFRKISNEGTILNKNVRILDLKTIKEIAELFFDEYSDVFSSIQLPVYSDFIHIGGGQSIKLFITKSLGTYIIGCTIYTINFQPISDSHIMYYHINNKSKNFYLSQCDEYVDDICKNFEALLSNVEKQLKEVKTKVLQLKAM